MALPARTRPGPDETRARILEKSEELFRRLGFAKTAVADIAAELGMSPANVYRFFASKNALVEAICQQHLARIHEDLTRIVAAKAPVADRLERFILCIIRYHKANFLHERRLHDIVLVAMEHSWDSIEQHKRSLAGLLEAILRIVKSPVVWTIDGQPGAGSTPAAVLRGAAHHPTALDPTGKRGAPPRPVPRFP